MTSPALIRMLISDRGKEGWESLNVCPVSISYEWDPCDALKVRELLITDRDGAYEKSPGEDEMSMALGLSEMKGDVHLHFCNPLTWIEEEGERTEKVLATKVDEAVFRGYKIFPNQIIASSHLGHDIPELISISEEDSDLFDKRIQTIINFIGDEFSKEEITNKWCEITAKPLLNHLGI